MKNIKWMLAAVMSICLTAGLAGCGQKEAVMKEFVSEDGAVSVMAEETWKVEDLGMMEGWLAITDEKGIEGLSIMSFPKSTFGISKMEEFEKMMEDGEQFSNLTEVEAVVIPGVSEVKTYRCQVNDGKQNAEAFTAYGYTDYAFYAFIYVPDKMKDTSREQLQKLCESFKETPPEVENNFQAEVTDTIQYFNAACALLTKLNGWDYTLFGGLPANEDSMLVVQTLLSQSWQVTDKTSADAAVDLFLTGGGDRAVYVENMEYLKEEGVAEAAAEDRAAWLSDNFEITAEEAEAFADQYNVYEVLGESAVSAWDYSRAMSLYSYYFQAGYYTEAEALDASLALAETMQKEFESWDEFMESCFLGYEQLTGESSDELRTIYSELKAASDNPYRVDWNTALEKSW